MIHSMKLKAEPFMRMAAGTKKIEYRLNDEKRQKVKAGDIIIFTNMEDDSQLETKVIALVKAHTFAELRTKLVTEGYLASYNDFEPAAMLQYYSKDDESKYGVIGICISLI